MNETNLQQYYTIDHTIKVLTKRREELKKLIVDEAVDSAPLPVGPGQTLFNGTSNYSVRIQVKKRAQVDEGALQQLLAEKGLLSVCLKEVVDHDLVEQFFIEGAITDADLRSIQGDSSPIFALKVERGEDLSISQQ